MDDPEDRRETPGAVGPLREETANLRDLLRACPADGIPVPFVPERMRSTRKLVAQRRFDEAFRQLRELRAEMLDQPFAHDALPPLLPAEIENQPVATPPPGGCAVRSPPRARVEGESTPVLRPLPERPGQREVARSGPRSAPVLPRFTAIAPKNEPEIRRILLPG